MMYRRILMPLDGSAGSAQATGWGLRFAHKVGAEVTFLHVLENPLLGTYALPSQRRALQYRAAPGAPAGRSGDAGGGASSSPEAGSESRGADA